MTYAENYLTSAIPSSFHTSLQLHPDRSISSFVSDLRTLGLSHSLVDPSLAASLISNTPYSNNILGKQLKMDPHFNQHPMSTVKPSYTAASHAQPVTYSSRTSPKKEDLPVQSSLTFNPHGDHQSYSAAQHYPGFKPSSETVTPTTVQSSNVITTSSQMPPPGRSGRSAIRRVKFQCHLCPSTFSRKDNLKTHHRLHSGEMPFQCQYCGRRFRWQSSARTHEQVHERHGHSPKVPKDLLMKKRSSQAQYSSSLTDQTSQTLNASLHEAKISRDDMSVVSAAQGDKPGSVKSISALTPSRDETLRYDDQSIKDELQEGEKVGSRRRRSAPSPEQQQQYKVSRKASRAPNIVLDLDGMFEDVGPMGSQTHETNPVTQQLPAPGESPMFSLPKLSHQELEKCME